MNRKLGSICIALCLILTLPLCSALAASVHTHTVVIDPAIEATCTEGGLTEGEHCSECGKVLKAQETVPSLDHLWGERTLTENSSQHAAACVRGCGAAKTVKCTNVGITLGRSSMNICAICGTYKYGTFELIPQASALPVSDTPADQRGTLVVRGKTLPFEDTDPSVLYAFTLTYEWNGGMATFKNQSTISIPIDAELPEEFQLIRVSVSPGDDSVQRKEVWVGIEHDFTDGILTFAAKNPSLYIIKAME